eukprot:1208609-Karenia_brevis.AAC.1
MQLGGGGVRSLAYEPTGQSLAVGCENDCVYIIKPGVNEVLSQMQLGGGSGLPQPLAVISSQNGFL